MLSEHLFTSYEIRDRYEDMLDFIPDFSSSLRYVRVIPENFTSPPTEKGLCLTPEAYRSDEVIDAARKFDQEGLCGTVDPDVCQILFQPDDELFEASSIGVLFFGGASVDPRAYSPIASALSDKYGIPVSIPIFHRDLAYHLVCESDRLDLASLAFPQVKRWVLAGHSMGGAAAIKEMASLLKNNRFDKIGGLVPIGSSLGQNSICGEVDFSSFDFPVAIVTGSADEVTKSNIGAESYEKISFPFNETFNLEIFGANHGGFGEYDTSSRKEIFGSTYGNATIPPSLQQEFTVAAIVHVASRIALPLPSMKNNTEMCLN